MNLNKKGFMMAEVVVVSAIVLIILTTLYVSYNQIYSIYKTRVNYYDAVTLYRLSYYRDILIENDKMNDTLEIAKDGVVDIYNSVKSGGILALPEEEVSNNLEDRVFLIYNNQNKLFNNVLDSYSDVHITFKDYVKFLSTNADLSKTNYVMIMERCNLNNQNDCKYAYLEVYDGYEE